MTKRAPVISYGEEADDILLTARRAPDAAPSDQVLVLVRKADVRLTRTGGWDALGMRGTRSFSFTLEAEGAVDQVVPVPFADIAGPDDAPGFACAVDVALAGSGERCGRRALARSSAPRRAAPQAPCRPAPSAWPKPWPILAAMRATVREGLGDFERIQDDADALAELGFAIRMNNLKSVGSEDGAGDCGAGARRLRNQRLPLRLAVRVSAATCGTRTARR